MIACVRCRKESTSDVLCSNCGMFVSNEVANTATKKETLEFLDKLKKDYIEKIAADEKRKAELDRIVRRTPYAMPKYTRIRFLWPFFIIGIVAEFIVAIAVLSAGYAMDTVALELILILTFFITMIVGFVVSGNMRDRANEPIYAKEMEAFTERHKAEKERETVETELKSLNYRLAEFNDIIPSKFLTMNGINSIIKKIDSEEASNISDAVSKINLR